MPDRPTRVLHLLNGEVYSGLERVVDHLAAGAPSAGVAMELALVKPGSMTARMTTVDLPVHRCPMRHRCDFGIARTIAGLARSRGCSVLHSHTVRGALLADAVRRRTGLPWVHHVHSPALAESSRRGLNLVNYLAERRVLRFADRILAVSRSLADYASRHYGIAAERMVVVPNGVLARAEGDLRRPVPGADGPVFAAVGWFRPRKGVIPLVHAFARVRAAQPRARLELIGEFADPSYERDVRALVDRLGLREPVCFRGHERDVHAALRRAHVFVMPSLYGEGMPMALLEAMSAGLPIVASDVSGIDEALDDGAGLLVPPGDPDALARAMLQLASDAALAGRLAQRAVTRQRAHLSVAAMQRAVYAVYLAVAPTGTAARCALSGTTAAAGRSGAASRA